MFSFVHNDVYTDLECFSSLSNDSSSSSTILNVLDNFLITKSSVDNIVATLKKPVYNSCILTEKQEYLQKLIHTCQANQHEISKHVAILKSTESDVNWIIDKDFDKKNDIIDVVSTVFFSFFPFVKLKFNDVSLFLTCKNVYGMILVPIINIMSPLMYIIIPYFVLIYKLKFRIPIRTFISFFYKAFVNNYQVRKIVCFQMIVMCLSIFVYSNSLLTSLETSSNIFNVCKTIYSKTKNVIQFVHSYNIISKLFGVRHNENDLHLIKVVEKYNPNNLINFGEKLVLYKNFKSLGLEHFRNNSNKLLANLAIVNLFTSREMCFTKFVESTTCRLEMKDLYHLILPNSVKNSVFLTNNHNCIITGPNAAGKSTIIKSILLNVLLSQTYGIACCKECVLTPFYHLSSQINIPDVKGKMSLFEAEMFRCKQNVDIIDEMPFDRKSLIVLDEVFSSTNIIEGISGAYGILDYLGKKDNVCVIATTHYQYLTKLPHYLKFKMEATVDTNNDIIKYDYLLKKGTSKQYIALEILKNNFNTQIIDIAINTKHKLLV